MSINVTINASFSTEHALYRVNYYSFIIHDCFIVTNINFVTIFIENVIFTIF